MRTFERTHPWLKFNIDLRKGDYEFWMAFGEAQSKCEHIANVPLVPATAEKLHQIYLAKGALATTAIEADGVTEGDMEVVSSGQGFILKSPDLTRWRIEVSNAGTLSASAV